ncbi:NAD(P)-dependent oxidoreductase [Sinisalibacter lacisalsi]|uniref:3-hydroxyisobutyrate dehydrogenase n=1 Tax=Sinisalibacter lacisalsi TaxID=1526570 RepID=A0ABQ1QK40_9RHOB|nr:NAD(P)-dependent oxidoreductase [Sinisalibacter lacisalsi]GGD27659.1 3-hydroxyisobutyrate dehydrogenase [Sinisalibacter lacisalsi]
MAQGTRIGIIGTGRMGTAFARRLIDQNHQVTVWNRSAKNTAQAAGAGAEVAQDIAALCSRSDVVISSLTDFSALWDVFSGDGGLAAQDLSGKLVIEMSTILPDEQTRLAKLVEGQGGAYLECPVGGTVGPALKGQLLGFAGGDAAAWEQGAPVLAELCKRVEQVGPVGAGAAMKLAVNLPLAMYWNTLGEALQMLEGYDLPAETIVSLMADSSAGPNVLKNRLQVVVDTLDGTDQPGTFDIDGLRKDLALAVKWASRNGKELPLALRALETYNAAREAGLGGFDGASLARFVRDGS